MTTCQLHPDGVDWRSSQKVASLDIDKLVMGINGIVVPVDAINFSASDDITKKFGKLTAASITIDRANRVDF